MRSGDDAAARELLRALFDAALAAADPARAIPPHLPAPTTIVLPATGGGRYGGIARAGSAAASAASNSARSSSRAAASSPELTLRIL